MQVLLFTIFFQTYIYIFFVQEIATVADPEERDLGRKVSPGHIKISEKYGC